MGDINYIEMGTRITELRKSKGLTQEQLSEILEVSRAALSSWENGTKDISLENVVKLCKFFDVDAEYLVNGIDFEGYKSYKKQLAGEVTGLSPKAIDNMTGTQVLMKAFSSERQQSYFVAKDLMNVFLSDYSDGFFEILSGIFELICIKDSSRNSAFMENEYYSLMYRNNIRTSNIIDSINSDMFSAAIPRIKTDIAYKDMTESEKLDYISNEIEEGNAEGDYTRIEKALELTRTDSSLKWYFDDRFTEKASALFDEVARMLNIKKE